ncbi:LuxR family transcriptional regulator [Streptomyces sp. NPDC093097]|uniref:LuxR family transcriptional regulator n=1 Tax=Streptomyces sp. NPDC093097 TaxID=3366027 RepID=UPI00380DC620
MVGPDDGRPGRAYPVPPTLAADLALRPFVEKIASLRSAADNLQASFPAYEALYAATKRNETPMLTLIHGGTNISQALESAVDACTTELLTAQPGGGRSPELLGEALERGLPMLARGVRQRTLYQHTIRSHRPTCTYVETITAAGAEVRTLAEVFDRLIICDQTVAFIPVSEETASTALEIRHPALIRYLTIVFNRSWDRASPLGSETDPERTVLLDDLQRTILRAVVSGETDDRVARRLGMSRRSVLEHVRRASEQVGSKSRAQLGYILSEMGILGSLEDD